MADKTIGELPSISAVSDSSLIPVEQNGSAGKMTGAQFKQWAIDNASQYATAAQQSATAAAGSATAAGESATSAGNSATTASQASSAAQDARQKIEDMGVASTTLDPGSSATVTKTVSQQGVVTLTFGIPQGLTGEQGATGPQGAQGVQGLKGDTGTAAVVAADGLYHFNVDNNRSSPTFGHLMLTYTGDSPPDFSIDTDPTSGTYQHLLWTVPDNDE